jgi:two-component system chemotaxis response regulator CheY
LKKLLIVDDSATMRKIIMRVLRQADLRVDTVVEASNGIEGLERLASHPDIQMILSDVNMPEMNGLDFVRAVRAWRGKHVLPMVMITTEGGEAVLETAMDCGANGFVTKPFTPETIREALGCFFG